MESNYRVVVESMNGAKEEYFLQKRGIFGWKYMRNPYYNEVWFFKDKNEALEVLERLKTGTYGSTQKEIIY